MFKKNLWIIVVVFSVGMVSAISNWKDTNAVLLTENMSFSQIQRAMDRYPPHFKFGNERSKILQSMDAMVSFSVKHDDYLGNKAYVNQLSDLSRFYRQQVDKGLDALERTKVKKGEVCVFKFYSSSIILKSSEGVVAIDFCQGPVGNFAEPEETDYYKSGFYLTPYQRDKLAQLIDIQVITHWHHDHADFSLASRLRKKGKIVIATAQNRRFWSDKIQGITVPDYDKVQKFGCVEILAQKGYQYADTKIENDLLYGFPSANTNDDSESIRYLIKMGGIVFLHSAETYTDGYDWLKKASSMGWKVNVVLSQGLGQGERSVNRFLNENPQKYFYIPIHEYELMHENGGNRTAIWLKDKNFDLFEKKEIMPLLWGENFCVTKKLLK